MEVNNILIQLPREMMKEYRTWDPRIGYEMKRLREEGTVAFFDYNLYRFPLDALIEDIKHYRSIEPPIIWLQDEDSWKYYRAVSERIMKEFGAHQQMGWMGGKWVGEKRANAQMDWGLLDLDFYRTHSPLPYKTTLGWRARGHVQFRLPKGSMAPRNVMRELMRLKQLYWYDSLVWSDDLSADFEWTFKILKELDDNQISFEYAAEARYDKLDTGIIVKLRDSGLRLLDFGELPITIANVDTYRSEYVKLISAIEVCRKQGVWPIWTWVIEDNTAYKKEDAKAAIEMNKTYQNVQPLKVLPDQDRLNDDDYIGYLNRWSAGDFRPHFDFRGRGLNPLEIQGLFRCFERGTPEFL